MFTDQTLVYSHLPLFLQTIYREYLTGFHKRKLHRQNVAREIAKKKEYEEKLEARKEVSHISN